MTVALRTLHHLVGVRGARQRAQHVTPRDARVLLHGVHDQERDEAVADPCHATGDDGVDSLPELLVSIVAPVLERRAARSQEPAAAARVSNAGCRRLRCASVAVCVVVRIASFSNYSKKESAGWVDSLQSSRRKTAPIFCPHDRAPACASGCLLSPLRRREPSRALRSTAGACGR
jgi:hypothetical protein